MTRLPPANGKVKLFGVFPAGRIRHSFLTQATIIITITDLYIARFCINQQRKGSRCDAGIQGGISFVAQGLVNLLCAKFLFYQSN